MESKAISFPKFPIDLVFMHKDEPLFEFSVIKNSEDSWYISNVNCNGLENSNFNIFDKKFLLSKDIKDRLFLYEFLTSRGLPVNREKLAELTYNEASSFVIKNCYGVSPQDSFWFKNKESKTQWRDVDPYGEISVVYKLIKEAPEKTNLLTNRINVSNNAWRLIGDNYCFVKKGSIEFDEQNLTPIQEALAMGIGKCLGFNMLNYNINKEKDDYVVISKDMTEGKYDLITLDQLMIMHGIKKDLPRSFDSIIDFLEKCGLSQEKSRKFFGEMMIFDSLIGNKDRHTNNIAFFCDSDTGKVVESAPLFDNSDMLLFHERGIERGNCPVQIFGTELIFFDNFARKGLELLPEVDFEKLKQNIGNFKKMCEIYEKATGLSGYSERLEKNLTKRIMELELIKRDITLRNEIEPGN